MEKQLKEIPLWLKEKLETAQLRLGQDIAEELWNNFIKIQKQGIQDFYQGKYAQAHNLLEQSKKLCQKLNIPDFEVIGYLGDMCFIKGDYQQAIVYFQEALLQAKQLPDSISISNNLARIGDIFFARGKHQKAYEHFQEALTHAHKSSCSKGVIDNLGRIGEWHFREGDDEKAYKYFQEAFTLAQKSSYSIGIIYIQGRIGDIFFVRGDHQKAYDHFQEALVHAQKSSYSIGIIDNLYNIGIVYFREWKNLEALNYFQKSLKLAQELSAIDGILNNLGRIGEIYFRERKNQEASEYFQEALTRAEQIDSPIYILDNLARIGNIHLREGKPQKALDCFQKSLALAQELPNSMGILFNLHRIGNWYFREGNNEKALTYFQDALVVAEKLYYSRFILEEKCCIGQVYLKQGKLEESFAQFQEALVYAQQLPYPKGILDSLVKIGEIYFVEGDYQKAFATYDQALKEVGREGRSQMTDRQGRMEFNRSVLTVYKGAIRAAEMFAQSLEKKDVTEALSWHLTAVALLEESRSVEVSNEIETVSLKPVIPRQNSWISTHTQLQSLDPFFLPDSIPIDSQASRRGCIEVESLSACHIFEKIDKPKKQAQEKGQERIINLRKSFSHEDISKALDPETVVLGYFVEENVIYHYIMDLGPNNARLLCAPSPLKVTRLKIQSILKEFEQTIYKRPVEDKSQYTQWKCLNELYDLLAIKESLEKVQRGGRKLEQTSLLISSESLLYNVPFAALYDGKHCLYEKIRDIHFTISLRTLAIQRSLPLGQELYCTFFGVPGKFNLNDQGEIIAVSNYLPGVMEEAKELIHILGKEKVVFFGHNGPPMYQARYESMKIYHKIGSLLYFAGHGVDIEKSLNAGPVLMDDVLPWNQIIEEPEWNFTSQVTIILSSCLLGRRVEVGNEMLGMIAALFSKGASSVISALWAVSDSATAKFMPRFVESLHKNLAKGESHPRSCALKFAMNYLRQVENGRYDVPYFFAPFFVSGLP